MIPVTAVGRTAVAVGGLADSGFVIGMARSRVWIGVLGVLLGGIVAINVWGLGLSAGSSATAAKIDELQREISVSRGRLANQASNDRISAAAGELGLRVPPPDGVHYLNGGSSDAERAAERLTNGRIELAPPPLPPSAEEVDPALVEADPAVVVAEPTIDPVTGLPVEPIEPAIDPATGLPTIDPATGLPPTP